MEIRASDLKAWAAFVQAEALNVRDALRDRGAKFFLRPLLVAGILPFCSYWYLYLPSVDRLADVAVELEAWRAVSVYSQDYLLLKERLDELYRKLPKTENPDRWLLDAIRGTLRREGIVPLSTSPPATTGKDQYRFISIQVRMQANYRQVASWISRLERGKNLLFVKDLKLAKDDQPIGSNTVDVTITTVVPQGEGG